MNRTHLCRRVGVGLSAVVTAGLAVTTGTAGAVTPDGPPVIEVIAGQAGPTAGGTAMRIYGSGFLQATSVKFGGVNATKFKVVDGKLITAVAPAAAGGAGASNTSVNITVTDPEGTGTGTNTGGSNTGWYYTNATLSVTPATVVPGQPFTVTLNGYAKNVNTVIPEVNPLLLYWEGPNYCPPDCGPPPWAAPYTPFPGPTNSSGNLVTTYNLQNPFGGDTFYDPNAVCPVNQKTVNYLGNSAPASFSQPVYAGRCLIAQTQFAIGTLDTPIHYNNDPTPAAPVLKLSVATANQGQKVTIANGSINWTANPFFGSSKAGSNPGETKTTLQICGIGGNANTCSSTVGTATVALTRYKAVNKFSGATMTGNIVVGTDVPHGCSTCFVRARQNRPVAGQFIEATAPLAIT